LGPDSRTRGSYGQFEIKDADELEAALKAGVISQAQFDLAWLETNRLIGLLERGELNLRDLPTV
jgi:predicted RNA-binding protein associated with RNAse of E/G family